MTTSTSRPVGYGAALEQVEEQLPAACFTVWDRELAKDLKAIVAEVLLFHPETEIRIGGRLFPARIVQEIYRKLQPEHLELVMENFRAQVNEIKRPKAYLRTALYNAVFELNARYINMVASDAGGNT